MHYLSKHTWRRRLVVGVVVVSAGAIVGVSASVGTTRRAALRKPHLDTRVSVGGAKYGRPDRSRGEVSLARHFAIFRRPVSHAASVGVLEKAADNTLAAEPDPSNARYATSIGPSEEVWAVPGRNGACIAIVYSAASVSFACGSTASAEAGSMLMVKTSSVQPGEASNETVIGLVPDDNMSVSAHLPNGGSRQIAVRNNIWVATGGQAPTSVSARNVAGNVVSIPVP
jgi:hypothetical protein